MNARASTATDLCERPQGNEYLDCLSAYSAVNQGHCHPHIVKALTEQAQKLTLSSRAFHTSSLGPFSKYLTEVSAQLSPRSRRWRGPRFRVSCVNRLLTHHGTSRSSLDSRWRS